MRGHVQIRRAECLARYAQEKASRRNVSVAAIASSDDVVRVAAVGDIVKIHFLCKGEDGGILESSYEVGEPLSFEVGAGDMMGNKLFQGFDEAVRGLAVGQKTELEASGGEWKKELLFSVTTDHPEVLRLQGRYKNQGGLKRGLIVELSNNAMAMVIDVNDQEVKIDANNMLAGKVLTFELEVISIENSTQ
ncbi:hypothetical protein CEUSTIGMA_g5000.t1 [Chlamydomonas eustigma]|uniref:peptidylprolyl isomerase n=1 Tax=Chlamydomonas eustigma TaxID=1157962 RepID=A0A250X3C9_9CHLO|nr:hypothetical protein CEUSTIGMA_g5000.t1 [Chlamydomonas eustigma]|eukprot:GAX77556.1 hypothetical protein CEUSTIGMA_g5000.t1 [Chlamydomonas eustigma]